MFIPVLNALYIVYENMSLTRRETANQMAVNTAAGFAIAQDISDRRIAAALKDTWVNFGEESRDVSEWSRIFSNLTGADSIYRDILLADPDGRVVAAGRPDSPGDISNILGQLGQLGQIGQLGPAGGIPSRIYRGEAFTGAADGEYLLPYIGGVGRDQSGGPRYALVFLVTMDTYQSTSGSVSIPDGIEICVTDRTGRVIFRHPQISAAGGSERGARIPFETWREIRDGPIRAPLPTMTSNRIRYYSAYSKFTDENGDVYGAVLVSLSGGQMPPMTGLGVESGAAILLTALLAACISFAAGLKLAPRPGAAGDIKNSDKKRSE
jgi:hypothetical protein